MLIKFHNDVDRMTYLAAVSDKLQITTVKVSNTRGIAKSLSDWRKQHDIT